ncbi:hypothetical protein ES288_A04G063600v1 [Gossypium darwinii]|uniref:Uncharacterized protein n=1 Tax=Gossypium darwinii TaxID=34276 RepID=A0A5D2GUU6_GOSDA|nr:hypothetical protein ES288_A04G063600v1 [Gossypium darwinii]
MGGPKTEISPIIKTQEGSGHGVDPGMGMDGGVCDGAGGRQDGRVGVVLVADSMGEWEEASGSLGFWDWAWMLG